MELLAFYVIAGALVWYFGYTHPTFRHNAFIWLVLVVLLIGGGGIIYELVTTGGLSTPSGSD